MTRRTIPTDDTVQDWEMWDSEPRPDDCFPSYAEWLAETDAEIDAEKGPTS